MFLPDTKLLQKVFRQTFAVLGSLLAFACLTANLRAEGGKLPEYQLKAAFLYNFAKFVQWPATEFASSNAPLRLAIVGEDPFGTLLTQSLSGKAVNGHPIQIIYIPGGDPIPTCHILFISRSEKDRLLDVLAYVQGRHVLTVADFEGFAQRGGMMNLVEINNAVRFQMNLEVIERARLKVDSKLGGLGILVKSETPKGGGK